MVALEVFEPDIAVQLPGCPSPTIARAVLNAAIDFCQRTHAWNAALSAATVTDDDFPYTVPAPDDAEMYRVLSVLVAGIAIESIDVDTLDMGGEWRSLVGTPSHWLMEDNARLRVYPLPAAPVALSIRASFRPTRSALVLPDFLASEHIEAIQAGALSRLLMIPRQEWTDMNLGAAHNAKFLDAAEVCKSAVSRSLGRSGRRVKTYFM
jgi:hypothetical protein